MCILTRFAYQNYCTKKSHCNVIFFSLHFLGPPFLTIDENCESRFFCCFNNSEIRENQGQIFTRSLYIVWAETHIEKNRDKHNQSNT